MTEITEELQNSAEWFEQHGRNTNTAIIGICHRAIEELNRQRGELRKKQVKIHKLLKELNQVQDYYEILKAKNERLHEVINGFEEQSHKELLKFVALSEKYTDAKAEIERLQSEKAKLHKLIPKMIKEAKSEAIKEFAERLEESAFDCDVSLGYGNGCYVKAVTTIEIDNLVKEMVGDNNV
jgi:DNA repair exonuclease SbcCD ATPase subunit